MQSWHSQDRHVVRLEWGPTGAESLTTYAVAAGSPVCAVVVDVLSFTTCVSVAVDERRRACTPTGGRTTPARASPTSTVRRSRCRAPSLGRGRGQPLARLDPGGGGDHRPRAALAERRDDQRPARRGGCAGRRGVAAQPVGRGRVARRLARGVHCPRPRPPAGDRRRARPASAGPTGRSGPPSRTSGVPARSSRPSPTGSSTGPVRCC